MWNNIFKIASFVSLFMIVGNLHSQTSTVFDSLYDKGVDMAAVDIKIPKEALKKMENIPNLSKVQIAKINYLKFKINKYSIKKNYKSHEQRQIKIENVKNSDSLLSIGIDLIHNSFPDEGLPFLFEFLEITKDNPSIKNKQYFCKINIAEGYRKKREFKKAINILYSFIYSKDISVKNLAYAYNRMSANYNEWIDADITSRIDTVVKYSELSIKISKEKKFTLNLASSLNELGYVYSNRLYNFKKAEEYFKEAYKYFIEAKSYKNAINTSINLSGLYLRKKEYKNALKVVERATNICDIEGNEDAFMRLYIQVANIYNYNKMYYEAYNFHSIGRKIQVELINNTIDKTINELAAKYDLKIKENQIEIEKQKLKNEKEQKMYTYLFFGFIVIIFIISYILIVLKNKSIVQQKKLVEIDKEYIKAISEIKNKELLQAIAKKLYNDKILIKIKNALKNNDKKTILNIVNQNINTENSWDNFMVKFTELHPSFFAKLEKLFPNLTQSEKKLSSLLFMNFKSKDIANVLNISENSVNKSRQRLRKKLNLPPASDISSYIKKNLQ